MRRVLVTGAAKGLGAAVALLLAKRGYSLVIHYRNSKEAAEQVASFCRQEGGDAEIIQGDFSTIASIETFLEEYKARFKDTYGIVNNVGNYLVAPAESTHLSAFSSLFESNVLAPFGIMKELCPLLEKENGAIINIGMAGLNSTYSDSYSPAYFATKAALFSLTRSFAKELLPKKIRVNMVSPGYLENAIDLPNTLPMGRAGTTVETAELVAFLLDAGYITGQNIEIAGGVRA